MMYAEGRGVRRSPTEAVSWFRKAADQGHPVAQGNLGVAYLTGQGVQRNYTEALNWLRKAADQNDAQAQANLASMYSNGQGVAKNQAEALKWYRKAADQGVAPAQFILGMAYAGGLGVAKNEAEATNWFRKAAEQGIAEAQAKLGVAYAGGLGIAKDPAEAVRWSSKAAQKGLPQGQETLRGLAEQGYAPAQNELGLTYEKGWGNLKIDAEAVTWYRRAAEQGLAAGQFNLRPDVCRRQGNPAKRCRGLQMVRAGFRTGKSGCAQANGRGRQAADGGTNRASQTRRSQPSKSAR